MVEKEIKIESDSGVHARPASMLVKLAMQFESEISLLKDGEETNAKSIMMVLAMGLAKGSVVTLRTEGPDEEEALNKIADLIMSDFK